MIHSALIQKPVISERSLKDALSGIFTFVVSTSANKHTIRREIETLYPVKVVRVTTANRKGKVKRSGKKRTLFTTKAKKIARVTLAKGNTIDLFEVGKQP